MMVELMYRLLHYGVLSVKVMWNVDLWRCQNPIPFRQHYQATNVTGTTMQHSCFYNLWSNGVGKELKFQRVLQLKLGLFNGNVDLELHPVSFIYLIHVLFISDG